MKTKLKNNYINLKMVVGLKVRDAKINHNFEWKPEERLMFGRFTSVQEGFYEYGHFERTPDNEILDRGYLIKGIEVYNKPYVKVIMANPESTFKVEFDDFDQANLYALSLERLLPLTCQHKFNL